MTPRPTPPPQTLAEGMAQKGGPSKGGTPAAWQLAPFLKWAGGKRSLLPQLVAALPVSIDTYYEPFLGGGALFFELARHQLFRKAVLADRNEELIQCYAAIRHDPEKVIRILATFGHDEDTFYQLRDRDPLHLPDAERAARTIHLNRSGFNGLYRVNSKGKFNVPFGRYATPQIVSPERLRAVARALKGIRLVVDDFAVVIAQAGPGDFVYLDPPYVPLSRTSKFTAYGSLGFDDEDQQRLAAALRGLGQRGVPALLSNSDCPTTRALYRGLRPRAVDVRRSINSDASKRGAVSELLVRSFAYPVRAKR